MDTAIITCARIDSKRLPAKNIKPLAGKALIRYTVEFAKLFNYPFYVFSKDFEIENVTTDCDQIYEPEELYDIPGNIIEKLKYINELINKDYIIVLQPTCPFRDFEKVKMWIEDFRYGNHRIGYSVYMKDSETFVKNGAFYIFRKDVLHCNFKDVASEAKLYIDDQNIDIDTLEDFKRAEDYIANKNNT